MDKSACQPELIVPHGPMICELRVLHPRLIFAQRTLELAMSEICDLRKFGLDEKLKEELVARRGATFLFAKGSCLVRGCL